MAGQGLVQVLGAGFSGQQVEVQRQLDQHTLLEMTHPRHEDRPAGETGVAHDFWQMFVLQAQAIELERRRFALLIGLDHGAPAAGVAGHCRQTERKVRRQQACVNQWPDQGDGACRIAAGVGHSPCLRYQGTLRAVQLGKAKHPAWCRAVRRGGVDDLGA